MTEEGRKWASRKGRIESDRRKWFGEWQFCRLFYRLESKEETEEGVNEIHWGRLRRWDEAKWGNFWGQIKNERERRASFTWMGTG